MVLRASQAVNRPRTLSKSLQEFGSLKGPFQAQAVLAK